MKHSYTVGCECKRCTKELARRTQQGLSNNAVRTIHAELIRAERRRTRKPSTRRPVVGSAEWAETRGDDIDSESGDY